MESTIESPKAVLVKGASLLAPLMEQHGFSFKVTQSAQGSGGPFAVGEFRKDKLCLKLFYRFSLAGVHYSSGGSDVPHREYMTALGVTDTSYPGYPDDPLDGFHHLLADLTSFGAAFLSGDTQILDAEAAKAEERESRETQVQTARAVGDLRVRQQARECFCKGDHEEVCRLRAELKYPEELTSVESRMFEISEK